MATAYCERADVEVMYGRKSVARWADLDNDGEEYTITARINWACELATEYINSRLTKGHYDVPFSVGSGGNVPLLIINLTAMYTGVLLYDGRQITAKDVDRDEVSRHRKDFNRFVNQIMKGQLKLLDPLTEEPLAIQDYNAPFIP